MVYTKTKISITNSSTVVTDEFSLHETVNKYRLLIGLSFPDGKRNSRRHQDEGGNFDIKCMQSVFNVNHRRYPRINYL